MAVTENTIFRRPSVVTLCGEVDSIGSERVSDVLSGLLETGSPSTHVDLAGVSYMDSQGLSAVLGWCEHFQNIDADLEIVSVNPIVRRLFELAGLSHIIDSSEDRSAPDPHVRRPITDCHASTENWEACSFSVSAKLESCKVVRNRVTQMAAAAPFSSRAIGDLKMAVGEAVSNAIRHGCFERETETVTVRCMVTDRALVAEISDHGPGFDPRICEKRLDPSILSEGGMGIALMRGCVDDLTFDFRDGTLVRLVKKVKP